MERPTSGIAKDITQLVASSGVEGVKEGASVVEVILERLVAGGAVVAAEVEVSDGVR